MTDDGERIAAAEVEVKNLKRSLSKIESALEKMRSDRFKFIVSILLLVVGVLIGIFRSQLGL